MDEDTSNCWEIRWVRLKVRSGDLRRIPRLISVMDQGKYYPVLISIEGEISLDECESQIRRVER